MKGRQLTDRQRREVEHYAKRPLHSEISFDLTSFTRDKDWNPYAYLISFVHQKFTHSNQRLLDFGCGEGASALRYKYMGYDVYGFDISPHFINNAIKLSKKYNIEVFFSIQAAEQLDYPSEFFDIISGEDILHHVEFEASICEIYRMLKKGGIAIFKDTIEVPILDRIRNTKLVNLLVPKGIKNLQSKRKYTPTHDERILNERDIAVIKAYFPQTTIKKFRLLGRLSVLTGNRRLWGKIDNLVFRLFPFSGNLGDNVVLILKKC